MCALTIDFIWTVGKHEQDGMYIYPVVLYCIYGRLKYRV